MSLTVFKPELSGSDVKGVLFDMDGVILDTEKLYCRFWQEACNAHGYPMTQEQALGMRSLNRAAGQKKLESYFGPGIDILPIRDTRIKLMDAYTDEFGVDPKPGIRELLEAIRAKGLKCAITTATPIERVRRHLTPLGLVESFDAICTAYEVAKGKPEPDIYLYGAATLGLKPEECIALEDSPAGLLSASRAGCMTVMVPDRDPADDTTRPLLYALADSLTDVIGLL